MLPHKHLGLQHLDKKKQGPKGVQIDLENSRVTCASQGLHAVLKADLLARSWLSLPEQLDHSCTEIYLVCKRTWSKRTDLNNVQDVHCSYLVFIVLILYSQY